MTIIKRFTLFFEQQKIKYQIIHNLKDMKKKKNHKHGKNHPRQIYAPNTQTFYLLMMKMKNIGRRMAIQMPHIIAPFPFVFLLMKIQMKFHLILLIKVFKNLC
jgi:hypothetical protein